MSVIYLDNPPPEYSERLKNQFKKIPAYSKSYVKSLFPIVNWLPKYNLIWFSSDLTAGITIATLVIPQSIAYGTLCTKTYIDIVLTFINLAKIGNLPPLFGLYTSFFGVLIYSLFGTSKDISIGNFVLSDSKLHV